MDKLYTAIFGVAISSTDDDFEDFIDVVKSVIDDKPRKKIKETYIYVVFLVMCLIIVFFCLYSKFIVWF